MTKSRLLLAACLLPVILSVAAPGLRAAPLTFNTALPVARGEYVFRELFVYLRSGNDPSSFNRRREAFGFTLVFGYGIRGDLAAFLAVPLAHNLLALDGAAGRATRRAFGLGDISAFFRYTALQRDGRGWTFRLAPFAGLKAPTGRNRRRDGLGLLPAAVQSGTGSWDPFAGIVATYQTLAWQVDAQVSYRINTAADDFEAGDVFRADISFQYRLLPRELTAAPNGGPFRGWLYGVLELAVVHQGRHRVGGTFDGNSGGLTLLLTPALQFVTRRAIFEVGVQVPILRRVNGTALRPGVAVLAGVRVNF